jgi:hypothetical protein
MAAFNKFNSFITEVAAGTHAASLNASTDTLMAMLTNTAPIATNTVKANLTEITAGNGYTAGGADIQNAASQTAATITVTAVDVVWTATGGSIGPFQYVALYNDTPTSPADPLVGWYDYGSAVTLADGETFTLDFGANLLTLG